MKIIPNTNNKYSVSEEGEVFSHAKKGTNKMSPNKDACGYMRVCLCYDDKQHTPTVHSLIMKTFVGEKPFPKANINHIDGDKNNNSLSNLEYCTYKENHAHAIANGLRNPVGEGNGRSKLTKEKVIVMRHLYDIGNSSNVIARLFMVGYTQSSRVCKRQQWKHVN